MTNQKEVLKKLQTIPSIGKACALDLWQLGIRDPQDLAHRNPGILYAKLNKLTGKTHDICMLYTFRCAVYYCTEKTHEPEKLKWWYWKDKSYMEG